VTVFLIGFPHQVDTPLPVSVAERDELAEHEQVWIWDLYYAKTLHALGDSREAVDLRERLDGWAVQMVNKALEFFESLQRERAAGESSGRPN
jgi:hypothetical protein